MKNALAAVFAKTAVRGSALSEGHFTGKLISVIITAAVCFLLTGCGSLSSEPLSSSDTRLYFDTSVTITIYDDDEIKREALLKGSFDICEKMEHILSARQEDSELYLLDHRDGGLSGNRSAQFSGAEITVSDELASCIRTGLEAGSLSNGEFDITILPVSSLWEFNGESSEIPADNEIRKALTHVDQNKVILTGNKLKFTDPDTMIDLGAVAKGYISGKIKEYLKAQGCEGAVINLGGNISTLGKKGDEPFTVGVRKPFSLRNDIAAKIILYDGCVISSGTYERCFTKNGKLYHHILSAKTGYPADTELSQVTLIGSDDILCDTLSTVFMLTGSEKAEKILETEEYDIKVIFTDNEGNMTLYDRKSGERQLSPGETLDFRYE